MASTVPTGLLVCVGFCAVSSACVLYNKHLFAEGIFPHPTALVWLQALVAAVAVSLGRRLGVVAPFHVPKLASCVRVLRAEPPSNDTAAEGSAVTIDGEEVAAAGAPPTPQQRARIDVATWTTAVAYTAAVATGLAALSYVSVPMFSALKRGTILPQWCLEYRYARTATTMRLLPALALMVLGIVVAARNDLAFSGLGIALGVTSSVLQAVSFELGRWVAGGSAAGVGTTTPSVAGVLFANSIVSCVLLLPVLAVSGELHALQLPLRDPRVALHVVANAGLCLLLNWLVFLDCCVNSPLTHVVAGHGKNIATTVASVALWDARLAWPLGWLGVACNACGAVGFSGIKYAARVAKQRGDEGSKVV